LSGEITAATIYLRLYAITNTGTQYCEFDAAVLVNDSKTSWAATAGDLGANLAQSVAAQQARLGTLGGRICVIGIDDNADSDIAKSNYRFLHDGTGGTVFGRIYVTNTGTIIDTRRSHAAGRPGIEILANATPGLSAVVDDELGNTRVNATGAMTQDAWHNFVFRLQTASYSLRIDGVEVDSGAPSGALYAGDPYRTLAIMGLAGGTPVSPMRGGIQDIGWITRYITDVEAANLEGYLT
jgi:hypothetical protein